MYNFNVIIIIRIKSKLIPFSVPYFLHIMRFHSCEILLHLNFFLFFWFMYSSKWLKWLKLLVCIHSIVSYSWHFIVVAGRTRFRNRVFFAFFSSFFFQFLFVFVNYNNLLINICLKFQFEQKSFFL